MTIRSMTGFGRAESETDESLITVEVKSVNNRYKDYRFRMPGHLNSYEMIFREVLNNYFRRGSFDIAVQIKRNPKAENFINLDYTKITQFIKEFTKEVSSEGSFRVTDFLRGEFYKDQSESEREKLGELVKAVLEKAIAENIKFREREGAKLVSVFEKQIKSYRKALESIKGYSEDYQGKLREKFLKRFEEQKLNIESDDDRFQKEIIYYLEKLDIDEEMDRANIHLSKLENLFTDPNAEQGRQFEFLLQELHRETNTMGSKSGHEKITDNVVKMKVCLEKMREQALNIE